MPKALLEFSGPSSGSTWKSQGIGAGQPETGLIEQGNLRVLREANPPHASALSLRATQLPPGGVRVAQCRVRGVSPTKRGGRDLGTSHCDVGAPPTFSPQVGWHPVGSRNKHNKARPPTPHPIRGYPAYIPGCVVRVRKPVPGSRTGSAAGAGNAAGQSRLDRH